MKISRNNYEEYFIDYLDGKLSDSQIHEIEALLMSNEDLREELEGLEKILLKPNNVKFRSKENLKQPDLTNSVDESNFEFYCIAEMEGDLSPGQSKELNEFLLQDPKKQQTRALFQKTRIQSPANIFYKNKEDLKRSILTLRKIAVYRSLSIAAGIALLLALFFTIIEKDVEKVFVAELEKVSEKADTSDVNNIQSDKPIIPTIIKDEEKSNSPTDKIKTKSTGISFKVGTPIASAEKPKEPIAETQTDEEKPEIRLAEALIDTESLTRSKIMATNPKDIIDTEKLKIGNPKTKASASEFLTLQELAKKKYTDIVIKDGERKFDLWNVASAGVSRISEMTGSEISLSTAKNEEGENKKVSFNSRLISFSTPINRD